MGRSSADLLTVIDGDAARRFQDQVQSRRRRFEDQPPLGVVERRDPPASLVPAWWANLDRWVQEFHDDHIELWPPQRPGKSGFHGLSLMPWPSCWKHHRGLVEDLVALKGWQSGLLDGAEWAGGPRGWADWASFRTQVAERIQHIAQVCKVGHIGVHGPVSQGRR